MKNMKSYGYINYGPIPRNEYNAANSEMSEDNTTVEVDNPTSEEVTYSRHLKNRQSMHPSGRRKISGWSRSRKVNGWRAESAALHDEINDMDSEQILSNYPTKEF